LHLSKPEIINICKHLVEKNGIRKLLIKSRKSFTELLKIDEIGTKDIENLNSICRERQGRLVRETNASRKRGKNSSSFELFHFHLNFMDKLTKT
jgi:hypothetical protein